MENLLKNWHFEAGDDVIVPVIPDGCRDLICRRAAGKKPQYFLWPLTDHTHRTAIKKGDMLTGYRMKPGVRIDQRSLIAAVAEWELDDKQICERLDSFTSLPPNLTEALGALACGIGSVKQAADLLGVSQRSLQRLIMRETGRSPVYWLQLARVRKAGRAAHGDSALAEIAASHGFADQAHMSREFRRWLGITPLAVKTGAIEGKSLFEPGFG